MDALVPPLDVDVNTLEPAVFARLQITRACHDSDLAWAEIACDAQRYARKADLSVTLVGIAEQLLGEVAKYRGGSTKDLWRELMLNEALGGP